MSNASTSKFKHYLPYLIILGIFLILSVASSMPYIQGMKLLPHDVEQWLFMSTEIRDYYDKTGSTAHWTSNMFSGMPGTMIEFYSSGNWFQKMKYILFSMQDDNFTNPIAYYFWSMVSFLILARAMGINKWLGMIGGIAFAFSTYNPIIIGAGHLTKMIDIALIPALVGGVIYTYKGRYWLGAVITAITLAFFIDAGHFQIMFYTIFLIIAVVIAYAIHLIKNGKAKQFLIASGILLVIALLGAGTSATRLLITQEYNEYTMRAGKSELKTGAEQKNSGLDKDYAFKWSNGIGETFTIMVPNLYGGASAMDVGEDSNFGEELSKLNAAQYAANAPLYWGPQQADGISGSVYFGAIIVFLAILGLFVIRSNKKWWFFGAAMFLIMVSWGKNFAGLNYLLFDSFPLFNKFRSPNMAISVPSVIFPLLAVWGLNDLFSSKYTKEELWKRFKLGSMVALGIAVLVLLTVLFIFDYRGVADTEISKGFGQAADKLMNALREDRKAFATKDAFRSLAFIIAAFAALWLYLKGKIDAKVSMIILAVLVAIDIMPVANRYLNADKYIDEDTYAQRFAPRPVDEQIKKDPDAHYRVLDLSRDLFNSATTSGQHNTIGGYSPAKLQIYQDLITSHIGNLNSGVLNMLNAKYIIPQPQQGGALQAIPNPAALGNAWFVENVKIVNTAQEEMNALSAPSLSNPNDTTKGSFNPKTTAILRADQAKQIGNKNTFVKNEQATIVLKEYSPNKMVYESNNANEGFAVLSEIYYPKWKAYIDGKEVPIIRTNYVLRGLMLPAGKHTIELKFVADTFEKGESIAMISSLLLTLIIGAGLFLHFRTNKGNKKVDEAIAEPIVPEQIEINKKKRK